jgi:hypothetical protein
VLDQRQSLIEGGGLDPGHRSASARGGHRAPQALR